LRVLALASSYPRFGRDYHGRFIHDLCLRLHENGIDIKVLAPLSRSTEPYPCPFEVARFPYMPSRRIALLSERTMKGAPIGNLAQLPAYLASAFAYIAKERSMILHAHMALPMGFVASLDRKKRALVVTCHGSDCTLPYANATFRPFLRRVFSRADRLVAVSKYVKKMAEYLGAPSVKTEVVYLGVNTERFSPPHDRRELRGRAGLPEDFPVVGTLGRLVPHKRVEDIIEAARLVSGRMDALFLIGGGGPTERALRELARDLENVVFLGEVFNPALFHRLCDVFVLASVREGLSVSLQEAMATGCTPVAVDGFGCRELIEDGENGYLFELGSVDELASKLSEALEGPSLGGRARERILGAFDMDENVKRYIEIYRELAE